MLSREDNELICRVGPGTAMGTALRHFWAPVLMSSELGEPGGDPVHVELFGDNFVAFRDGNGTVGLLDEKCCHRGASLTIGRVEQCGIRCIYHGWLFAADGEVLETPNVADERFKTRFRAKSYPVREEGGLIWAYVGPADSIPDFPEFPFVGALPDKYAPGLAIIAANYVQVIEGLLDSSHLSVLHSSALEQNSSSDLSFAAMTNHMRFDTAPTIESEETDFGLQYAAIRLIDGLAETRVTAFLSPFWLFNANGDTFLACVPMTDEKTALFHVWYDGKTEFGVEPLKSKQLSLVGLDEETLSHYGQTRATADGPNRMQRANRYGQDRTRMQTGHFTGLPAITQEDAVVTTSSGPIRDRRMERLSSADLAIGHLYRVLLRSARRALAGEPPVAVGMSISHIAGVNASLEPGADWRTLVPLHKSLKERTAARETTVA